MPKMKTKRAAAKRFKVTGTGKIKRFKAYKRHILTKKSTKRKRDSCLISDFQTEIRFQTGKTGRRLSLAVTGQITRDGSDTEFQEK